MDIHCEIFATKFSQWIFEGNMGIFMRFRKVSLDDGRNKSVEHKEGRGNLDGYQKVGLTCF